jgi:fermentation-respiration switch protein FrsA (DUF1100 family)
MTARSAWRTGLGVTGVGLTLVVGLDGSWFWCLVRVLAVGAMVFPLMTLVHNGSARAGAIAAMTTGLVALPVGGAIGYPHLTKDGSLIRMVGGLLTFSGGLLLLVVGGVVLLRQARGWRRLLAIPFGLAVLYGSGFPVLIAVAATNVPRASLGDDTPETLGLGYTDVDFRTPDGVRLSGWYVPSANRAAVIVLHGASSTRSAVLGQAAVLARHGYGVLLFDARGAGRSGGRAMNFGWSGEGDVAGALDWLQRRPDVDPGRIGALGASMGGEVAIGALGADNRLRAVVAEGATNRVAGDWTWLDDRYGLRGGLQQAVNQVTYALPDLLTGAGPPATLRASVAAASPRPVLLIAAGAVPDEARAAQSIREASPSSVTVWVVEGAGHVGGLRTQPGEWERRVSGFLDASLSPASPGPKL